MSGDGVYLFVDEGCLVAGRPENFAEWQAALWEVEMTENGYVSSMVFKFRNAYTGDVIAFTHLGSNVLGGAEDVLWMPSSKKHDFTADNNFFFTPYGDRSEVLVLRPVMREGGESIAYDLIPSVYDNLAAAAADFGEGVKLFGWSIVSPDEGEQVVSLSANDLNTLLNTTGDYYERKFHAVASGTFRIQVEGGGAVSSLLSKRLQARSPVGDAYGDESGRAVLLYVPELGAYLVEENGMLATRKTLENPSRHTFLVIYDLGSGHIEILSMETGNYLTISGVGSEAHFVFGEHPDVSRFAMRIDVSSVYKEYPVWWAQEGLFLLKVSGVNAVNGDATIFNRKGKYVRLLPDGTPDWVDSSQELPLLPSAQWALQREGEKWLRVSNRAFAGQATSSRFPEKGIPRVPESAVSGDFFFFGGDTLKCEGISELQLQSPSEEYYEFFSTGAFSFQYLAENSGACIIDEGTGLAVGQGKRLLLVPEEVTEDTYGDLIAFNISHPARTAYRLYTVNEGKRRYVGQGKEGRYTLLEDIGSSSIFLFRQVRKVQGVSYFSMIETAFLPGVWVELDALGKVRKEYPAGVLASGMSSEGRTLLMARDTVLGDPAPQRYVQADLVDRKGKLNALWEKELITPVAVGGTGEFYIGFAPGLKATQVCLNSGSLLFNGKLGVDNTLFSIQPEEELRGADKLEKPVTGLVAVSGAEGVIVIKGAAGKEVTVSDLQGRILIHGKIVSGETSMALPRGVVLVGLSGEKAVKVFVH
jgi:hypothetical protein